MKYIKKLVSKSGKHISILIFESSLKPKITLIESHGGYFGSKEKVAEDNKELAEYCLKNNLNYISVDLSNNSTQKNQPVTELRFSDRVKDIETVIDFVTSKYKNFIALVGSSLGGFITINASNYSPDVKGLILNCAAVKVHECVRDTIDKSEFDNWKRKGVANVWGVPMSYDFYEDLTKLDATQKFKDINIPMLWFHGTSDILVPITQAREAKQLNSKIDLVEIIGGGHRFGDKMKSGEWENKVEEFLKKIMNQSNAIEQSRF